MLTPISRRPAGGKRRPRPPTVGRSASTAPSASSRSAHHNRHPTGRLARCKRENDFCGAVDMRSVRPRGIATRPHARAPECDRNRDLARDDPRGRAGSPRSSQPTRTRMSGPGRDRPKAPAKRRAGTRRRRRIQGKRRSSPRRRRGSAALWSQRLRPPNLAALSNGLVGRHVLRLEWPNDQPPPRTGATRARRRAPTSRHQVGSLTHQRGEGRR